MALQADTAPSRGNELGNAHEIVGDKIEHEICSDSGIVPLDVEIGEAALLALSR